MGPRFLFALRVWGTAQEGRKEVRSRLRCTQTFKLAVRSFFAGTNWEGTAARSPQNLAPDVNPLAVPLLPPRNATHRARQQPYPTSLVCIAPHLPPTPHPHLCCNHPNPTPPQQAGPRRLCQAAELQRVRQHGERQPPHHAAPDHGLAAVGAQWVVWQGWWG